MELLTPELLAEFEKQGYCGDKRPENVRVIAKFFNPVGAGAWFATEYYPEEKNFFGYATLGDPDCAELGYFSLDELESLEIPVYLEINGKKYCAGKEKIKRDLHWNSNTTLREVMNKKGVNL